MKLLVVDHNAIEPANRVLYEKIVEKGNIELRLVVPEKWFNNYRLVKYEAPALMQNYELFSSDVLFPTRTHRLIYRDLYKHLKEFQPDVFYMHAEPENFAALEAALLKSSATRLVFYTARNVDHMHIGYPYKLSFIHKLIEKFVLHRAAHGIACNSTAPKLFARHGFSGVTAIPLSVDTQMFHPLAKPMNRSTFVIGYVGRFESEKGVSLLVHALAQLPEHYVARIMGGGSDANNVRRLADSLGVLSRVEFLPAVDQSRVPEELGRFDVLVLPSRTMRFWKEQFGRVLIEAMACGVPVIGSDSGEIPAVIGDAGLVFKENSVEGLRIGIERLYADARLREHLITRGRERVEKLFSVDVVASRLHRLFTSL